MGWLLSPGIPVYTVCYILQYPVRYNHIVQSPPNILGKNSPYYFYFLLNKSLRLINHVFPFTTNTPSSPFYAKSLACILTALVILLVSRRSLDFNVFKYFFGKPKTSLSQNFCALHFAHAPVEFFKTFFKLILQLKGPTMNIEIKRN